MQPNLFQEATSIARGGAVELTKLEELQGKKDRLFEELERVGEQQRALSSAVRKIEREQKSELEGVKEHIAQDPLSYEDVERWAETVFWQFARTMPGIPHEYAHSRWCTREMFERVVRFVWKCGYDRWHSERPWRSLDVGEHYIWVCTRPGPDVPAPVEETILINRAPHPRDEAARQPKLSD